MNHKPVGINRRAGSDGGQDTVAGTGRVKAVAVFQDVHDR